MRTTTASFLLTLGLSSLIAAEVPTFTLGDPNSYLGNIDRTDVGGNDIIVSTDNGVTITFGRDLSKKIVDVASNQCKSRGSPDCLKQTLDVMGVGNAANGLQKRVIPVLAAGVGVAIAYIAGVVWTAVYLNNESKNYNVVELKIPQSQVDEVSKWKLDEDKFNFKDTSGDTSVVQIDTNPTQLQTKPTIETQSNGDIKATFPGIVDDLKDMWSKIKCTRSLQKRITLQCLVQYAQAFARLAQDGGNNEGIQDVSLLAFPKPNNNLYVSALGEDFEYTEELYIASQRKTDEVRNNIATISTWVGFGYAVENLAISALGEMVFPKKFLDSMQLPELPVDNCWDEDSMPFCTNCGGNTESESSGQTEGKCKGFDDGNPDHTPQAAGCTCHVDDPGTEHLIAPGDLEDAIQYLMTLTDDTDSSPPAATDGPLKCNGLDSNKYVAANTLDDKIIGFCSGMQTQGTQDKNTGSYSRTFNSGTRDEVELAVDWPPGQTLNMLPCAATMNEISAGCDNPAGNNPRNWKGGGSKQVGIGLFHINPKVIRSPHPTKYCPDSRPTVLNQPNGSLDPKMVRWQQNNICGDICPDGYDNEGGSDPTKARLAICKLTDAVKNCAKPFADSTELPYCWIPAS
ncbi:hypothetical protein BU25DRAFT_451618 [Macroventuria anomochaeta]|uniref:Uncharacterized protein n=1 Tax=Macroventuria anomochaeta TaxID=301207 RepID=A0ACB6RLV8_9PLEO|nr:uncharacterized protein BU25DRAFT_451618 [Macroventuria anomochaeta]KAF2622940.1 hypothetical protein BU25DRAFT_451618 [Macroventuria anomochaeta]